MAGPAVGLHLILPLTSSFADQVHRGRARHYFVCPGQGTRGIHVYNLYDYTGGSKNPANAGKTNQLLRAILLEIEAPPKGPTLIVGDVNADIDSTPVLQNVVEAGLFIDVGAHADVFGQIPNQPTCMARNATKPTRRDFVFSSPDLFPALMQFQVVHADTTPVHATFIFRLNGKSSLALLLWLSSLLLLAKG